MYNPRDKLVSQRLGQRHFHFRDPTMVPMAPRRRGAIWLGCRLAALTSDGFNHGPSTPRLTHGRSYRV